MYFSSQYLKVKTGINDQALRHPGDAPCFRNASDSG
jgi:hypothetical protein